ncbi:hypothetical protein [Modicisalibacter xianhensis]|uniref:hypothetical protein n=1 Tax=Modicisalibacter xianhensis TaxID=442341 RepID=UPI001063900E|nr:hypothetical protein [Halomonas xianhensis]
MRGPEWLRFPKVTAIAADTFGEDRFSRLQHSRIGWRQSLEIRPQKDSVLGVVDYEAKYRRLQVISKKAIKRSVLLSGVAVNKYLGIGGFLCLLSSDYQYCFVRINFF